MVHTEEVYPNKGKLYGAHTGKEYKKSETEDINGIRWSKPDGYAPDQVVKVEDE